jgi:hypothetical protein
MLVARSSLSIPLAVLLVAGLGSATAAAAPCPVDPIIGEIGASASDLADVDPRTAFLEEKIERGAYLSRAWAVGWGVSLGVLTVGQLSIAPTVPAAERPEWWVGAGASAVGALTRAVFVPRVLRERRRLRRDPTRGCARVHALEGALARSAAWELTGRSLLMHGLSLGFNAGVGLVLGLAFDRPIAANRLASLGAVVGEVMIITQPRWMTRSLEAYGSGAVSQRQFAPGPFVTAGGGGLMLRGRI